MAAAFSAGGHLESLLGGLVVKTTATASTGHHKLTRAEYSVQGAAPPSVALGPRAVRGVLQGRTAGGRGDLNLPTGPPPGLEGASGTQELAL